MARSAVARAAAGVGPQRRQIRRQQAAAKIWAGEIYREGIWTSKTSKHSPHWTEVSACFNTAWSSALHDGQENW